MKNVKLMLAVLFLSLISNNLHAQISDEQKQEAIAQLKENQERLALTPEQQTPFKEITKKYAQQLKSIKDGDAGKRDKLQQLKEIQTNKNAEMKTLLSESQYKTYLEIQQERIARMRERRKQ